MTSACLWAALTAVCAHAQSSLVTTVVDPCVPIDRAQLERLLSIELGTSAETASSATGPTHVHVRCVPAGIELNLQDALTRKGMVRVLSQDSFRDASSTRLLALAIAEFVVASWVELRLPQKVEPAGPPPSPAAREAAESKAAERVQPAALPEPSRTQVGVAAQLQVWSEQDSVMFGLGARLLHSPSSWLALSLAGEFAAGEVEHALGRVVVRTGSVSLAALGRIELTPFVLLTGPGVRAGIVQLSGEAGDPSATDDYASYAPYSGLFWLARGELYATERFALTLDLELGAVTLPVRALVPVRAAAAIAGVWLTTGLGLAFEL